MSRFPFEIAPFPSDANRCYTMVMDFRRSNLGIAVPRLRAAAFAMASIATAAAGAAAAS